MRKNFLLLICFSIIFLQGEASHVIGHTDNQITRKERKPNLYDRLQIEKEWEAQRKDLGHPQREYRKKRAKERKKRTNVSF